MRCLAGANAATYRLPATRLSGCKTGAPSQEDVDRPDPPEVLVSKEACLQFYSVSLGLRLPPSGSGCLSPEGEGLQPAISVQSFVLCAGLAAPLRTTRVPEPERLGPGSSVQGRPLIVPGGTT